MMGTVFKLVWFVSDMMGTVFKLVWCVSDMLGTVFKLVWCVSDMLGKAFTPVKSDIEVNQCNIYVSTTVLLLS